MLLDNPISSVAASPAHGHSPHKLESGLQRPATPQLQSPYEQQATERSLSASAAGSSKDAAKSLSRTGQKAPVCANALQQQEWPLVWPSKCAAPSGLCTEKRGSLDCQGKQTGLATATLQDPTASALGVAVPKPKVSSWGHSLYIIWVWIDVPLSIQMPYHSDALKSALQNQLCLLHHPLHPTTSPNLKE